MGIWTARQIWKGLDREARSKVALALWEDARSSAAERLQALAPWMTARGLRASYLQKLPRVRRAALLAEGGLPEETAMQLLMSYHLVHARAMLGRFLDGVGIDHDDGVIKEEVQVDEISEERIGEAVKVLRAEFPEDDVEFYLRTLTATDPYTWEAVGAFVADP